MVDQEFSSKTNTVSHNIIDQEESFRIDVTNQGVIQLELLVRLTLIVWNLSANHPLVV